MHNPRDNTGPPHDHETSQADINNNDNADWTVLTEAASEFEAEVIAEAIRARGVNAIAVSLPPPMIPIIVSTQQGQAVVMVDRPDMHEAAIALDDIKQSRANEARNEAGRSHNDEYNSSDDHDPESIQAEYDRLRSRKARRIARYAVRLVIILAIIPIAAFNPVLAGGLLITLLAVEVLLLRHAIKQANNANDEHMDTHSDAHELNP